MRDDAGFWAVLRHADVVEVARRHDIFSSGAGGVVVETIAPETLARMRTMLLGMDPPRHGRYRSPVSLRCPLG